MSIKTWQERLVWITSTSYQGYASQEEIEACKQAELDELRAALARRTGEIEQRTETSVWQAGRISELLDDVAAQRKVLEQALEALNNSSDLVEGEYTEAVRRYGGMPSRQGKLAGLSALVGAHRATRTAIQEQLA